MILEELARKKNLELAWRRITTGGNQQYKRLYRELYLAYEIALNANLKGLRERILGGSFTPQRPERLYLPKPSGLHRPVTLLTLEDQIVLQAFANLAAKRMQPRREALQFRTIFSNILEKQDSIYFFRRWQDTYRTFQRRIVRHYASGRRWVGDFDLAAFYDTISHELLLRTIFPRSSSNDMAWIADCLRTWSSVNAASGHGHGLPQGPLASDFLAECFLLPVDLALTSCKGYVRYVDDVRLFGATEDDVRSDMILLERLCRERGLIPQSGKFALKRALSIQDAMGMLPSISDPQHDGGGGKLDQASARRTFRSALGGKPLRVVDKTRLRYALFRAEPDTGILNRVLRLIPHHPEHTDAFFSFVGRHGYRAPIEELCLRLVKSSPYSYVRGEAWHVLARYRGDARSRVHGRPTSLTQLAITIAKSKSNDSFAERWGVCHFLCVSEQQTLAHHSRFLRFQASLLQALLAPVLPSSAFAKGEVVQAFLQRTAIEPGLSVCSALHQLGLTPRAIGIRNSLLPSQVLNTLNELGVTALPASTVDPIAEMLESRYDTPLGKSWRTLLSTQYVHALGLLRQAESAFAAGRSFWLITQNAFNQTIFLALQRHLGKTGHLGACRTTNKHGELIDFGVTLDANGPFSQHCPAVANCFRDVNSRRNRLPQAHPYHKKTAAQSTHLSARERAELVRKLRVAYASFAQLMP